MPRIARYLGDGMVYHVLNRGNAKGIVFHCDNDYRAFIALMREAKKQFAVKLFAYCLMPTHFHMVVAPKQGELLSSWMQWLMTSHVRRYHSHYKSCGHVWQGRFRSFLIQEDGHFITVMRYVERNPVRAGLVASAHEWQWSSANAHIARSLGDFIEVTPIPLPVDREYYLEIPLIEAEVEEIRKSLRKQRSFGSQSWKEGQAGFVQK